MYPKHTISHALRQIETRSFCLFVSKNTQLTDLNLKNQGPKYWNTRYHQTCLFTTHTWLNTWIPILIWLFNLNWVSKIKVYYFKIKFNPCKLARWLYDIVRCQLEERTSNLDTGKVPNGHFLFFPSKSFESCFLGRQLFIFMKTSTLKLILGMIISSLW